MKRFNKIHDKIKFEAFGKVTLGGKQNTNEKKSLEGLEDGINNKTEDELAKELVEEQIKKANEQLEEIERSKNNKVGKIWEVRKKVIGGKKALMEATAVINPVTNELVVSRKEIKQVTLQYCKDTLANNKPTPEYEKVIHAKEEQVKDKLSKKL